MLIDAYNRYKNIYDALANSSRWTDTFETYSPMTVTATDASSTYWFSNQTAPIASGYGKWNINTAPAVSFANEVYVDCEGVLRSNGLTDFIENISQVDRDEPEFEPVDAKELENFPGF